MTKKTKALLRRTAGIFCLGGILLAAGGFTSCSEDKDTVEEYSDWQAKNEAYWNSLYTATQQKIKNGDTSWRTILNYTFQNQKNDSKTPSTYGPEDYIIVHVEQIGTGTKSPIYTDSVRYHCRGRLIPSTTYTQGFVFEESWKGTKNNTQISTPFQFKVSTRVDGLSTALQNMHTGDRWIVYVPYTLGNGIRYKKNIPAYSTLIYDITLIEIYHANDLIKPFM